MNEQFKPYVPADKVTPEMTPTSIIMGLLLAVIFGAANAYLGLRVGMTVSASIPAAVISMAVIRSMQYYSDGTPCDASGQRFQKNVPGSGTFVPTGGTNVPGGGTNFQKHPFSA